MNYDRMRAALPSFSLAPTLRLSASVERAVPRAAYRREIDGLRALAVAPVVLYHAGVAIFAGGFVGVDVFFVISGYLITGNIRAEMSEGRFSIVDFYERRIRRILPALYLVMICCLPFAWLWLFPREFTDFGRSLVSVCLFTSNVFFNHEIDYFRPDTGIWPLIHTWSLAVEEQFYLGFPILLMLARGLNRNALMGLLAALSAVSLGWAEWSSRIDPQSDFYLLPTRAWELGFGAILAVVPTRVLTLDRRLMDALVVLGLAALAGAICCFRPDMPLPGLWSLLPVGGTALLIAFATARTHCGRWLGAGPLVGVGLISYGAYLWHQPLFAFARFRFAAPPGGGAILAASAIAFALAWASWRFVERPFRDRTRWSRTSVFVAAGLTGAALIVVGRTIVLKHGFPARLPAIEGAWDVGAYRDKCLDVRDPTPDRSAEMAACQLGDRKAKLDFLLVGDSHAAALADEIDAAAARQGRRGLLIAANACLPVRGIEGQYPRSKDACRRLQDGLLEVVDRFGINLVLLHARWQAFDDSRLPEPAIRERLRETLTSLKAHGARTVIISDTPRAPFRVPDTLARKALFDLEIEERPRLAEYLRENSGAQRIFAAPEIRGLARIFDVYPFFCLPENSGFCEVAQRGHPYFTDDSHLASFGSLALSHLEEDLFR